VRIHNRNRVLGAVADLEFAAIRQRQPAAAADAAGTVGSAGKGSSPGCVADPAVRTRPVALPVEDRERDCAGISTASARVHVLAHVRQQPRRRQALVRQRTRWAQGNLQLVS